MNLSSLEQSLFTAISEIEVIDAHEHLPPEEVRTSGKADVFALFSHYTSRDFLMAGMSQADYDATQNYDLPLDYRWGLIAPYWEQIRWDCYARAALLAARKFYGADDINAQTYVSISEKIAAANTPGLYQRVLRDACRIRTSLTQCGRTDLGTPLLTPVMPLTLYDAWEGMNWRTLAESGMRRDAPLNSVDDCLADIKTYLLRVKSEGAVGLKMLSSPFQAPSRAEASETFRQLRRGALDSLPVVNPLRDYLVDEAIRFAGEHDLAVAVHTGYWGDFRTLDPLHMIPLLERHPKVRFDLYHLGYPWVRQSLMLGKGFPNVWLNFCWTHIISQRFAMDALDEAIDLLPTNKLLGFGGDYHLPVEKVYGHLTMAREDIARVLAARITRGQMTEDQALGLARKWLWDNPKELYRLHV